MPPDPTSLAALRERVEAASGPSRQLDEAVMAVLLCGEPIDAWNEFEGPLWKLPDGSRQGLRSWSASLDAVLALIGERFPGEFWNVGLGTKRPIPRPFEASISIGIGIGIGIGDEVSGATPALALLNALLSALLHEGEGG